MKRRAVVLLSGGLDSAVTLFYAKRRGYACNCLAFDYGQRHKNELAYARRIANDAGAGLAVVRLGFPWKGSSLTGTAAPLPSGRSLRQIRGTIPTTYVPGRNTVFMSIAVSYAEAIGASAVFIGAHAEDSSGYPDCRPAYLKAFNRAVRLGTKAGIEGKLSVKFPLVSKNKAAIIRLGRSLGVKFGHTWSCYKGGRRPCGRCDSCILRAKGFKEAGIGDPLYAA